MSRATILKQSASYDWLDEILQRHIEQHQSMEEIISDGVDEAKVRRVAQMIKSAEFKRKQADQGIKGADRAFGTGWRMPIACRPWDAGEVPFQH